MRVMQTEAFVELGGYIFASAMAQNRLVIFDSNKRIIKKMSLYPNEDECSWRLHCNAQYNKGKIYFFPDRAKSIHILDVDTLEIEAFPLDKANDVRFTNAILMDNVIYFFQYLPEAKILAVSIDDNSQQDIVLPDGFKYGNIQRECVVADNEVYFIDNEKPNIYRLDTKEKTIEVLKINLNHSINGGFGTICKKGDVFYLTTQQSIVEWNCKIGVVDEYKNYPQKYGMICFDEKQEIVKIKGFVDLKNNYEQPFAASIVIGDKVLFFPNRTNMILLFDTDNGSISEYVVDGENESKTRYINRCRVTHCHYIKNRIENVDYVTSTCTGKVYKFNNEDYKELTLSINPIEWDMFLNHNKGLIIDEDIDSNVDDLIKYFACN